MRRTPTSAGHAATVAPVAVVAVRAEPAAGPALRANPLRVARRVSVAKGVPASDPVPGVVAARVRVARPASAPPDAAWTIPRKRSEREPWRSSAGGISAR